MNDGIQTYNSCVLVCRGSTCISTKSVISTMGFNITLLTVKLVMKAFQTWACVWVTLLVHITWVTRVSVCVRLCAIDTIHVESLVLNCGVYRILGPIRQSLVITSSPWYTKPSRHISMIHFMHWTGTLKIISATVGVSFTILINLNRKYKIHTCNHSCSNHFHFLLFS